MKEYVLEGQTMNTLNKNSEQESNPSYYQAHREKYREYFRNYQQKHATQIKQFHFLR